MTPPYNAHFRRRRETCARRRVLILPRKKVTAGVAVTFDYRVK